MKLLNIANRNTRHLQAPLKIFYPCKRFPPLPKNYFALAKVLQACLKSFLPLQSFCKPARKIFRLCKSFANPSEKFFALAKVLQACLKSFSPLQKFCKHAKKIFRLCKSFASQLEEFFALAKKMSENKFAF